MTDSTLGTARVEVTVDTDKMSAGIRTAKGEVRQLANSTIAEFDRMNNASVMAGKLLGATLTAGAAAAAAAVFKLKTTVKDMLDTANRARAAGQTIEEFSRLDYAARVADVSIDALSGGLANLQRFQTQAAKGTKEQAGLLRQLGVEATTSNGALRPSSEVLAELADRLQRVPDGADRAALAVKLFGQRGADLLPLLADGSKGLAEMARKSDELGYTLSTETAQGADEAQKQMAQLRATMDGMWRQALPELVPQLRGMAETLNSPEMREGFSVIIGGATTAISKLLELAATSANVTRYLAEEAAARLHGPDSRDTVRVEQRIDRLKATIDAVKNQGFGSPFAIMDASELIPADLISQKDTILKRLQGELDKEQNKLKIGMELNAGAAAAAAKLAAGTAGATSGAPIEIDWSALGGGGGGGKKGKALPDFAKNAQKELERLLETEARARDQFNAMAATLDGPLAAAHHQYLQDQRQLNELAAAGAIESNALAKAQTDLTRQYEGTVRAIEAQLDPAGALIDQLREELRLRTLNNVEAQTAVDLASLAVPATQAQAAEILALNRALEDQARATQALDDFRRSASDALSSIIDGSKSAKDALGDFFDELYRQAARAVSDQFIQKLFGQYGSAGSGGGTAFGTNSYSSGGGGGWVSSLIGALFGGGRALGGDVQPGRVYEVGEMNRPEMFMAGGKQFLIPGNRGEVEPIRGGGSTLNQTVIMQVQGKMTNQTADQAARELGRETQYRMARA